jgi:hypothetical protein
MRHRPLLLLAALALAAACERGASVSGEQGGRLTLSRPRAVVVQRGGTGEADIAVTRMNVPGEIAVTFRDLPHGVAMVNGNNTMAGDGGSFTLRASDSADLVEGHVAQVTVTGSDGTAVTQPIEITVVEKQP